MVAKSDGGIAPKPSGRVERKLTELHVKAFVAKREVGKKLSDGGGLYLTIAGGGSPSWRIKYRHAGKERLYTVGLYPAVTLEGARAELVRVKQWMKEGRDPMQSKRLNRAAKQAEAINIFQDVADSWLERQKRDWSPIHFEKSSRALERDVYPLIGKLPVAEITPAMVAAMCESIEKRGARETASRVLQHVVSIFRLAQAKGMIGNYNPAEPSKEILARRKTKSLLPALTKWPDLGEVLRKAELARLSPAVRMASRLMAFTVVRVTNLVEAEWRQFDLDAEHPAWVIPRKLMKAKDRLHDHRIPLAPEIVAELKTWRGIVGGRGFLFPGATGGKHITRESIEKAYRETLGLRDIHVPHGWRSAFSTLCRDHGFDRDAVELALDHVHDSEVARAYDRGERLQMRIDLMNWWAKQLMSAERGADVVPIKMNTAA